MKVLGQSPGYCSGAGKGTVTTGPTLNLTTDSEDGNSSIMYLKVKMWLSSCPKMKLRVATTSPGSAT